MWLFIATCLLVVDGGKVDLATYDQIDVSNEWIVTFDKTMTSAKRKSHMDMLSKHGLPTHNVSVEFGYNGFHGYGARLDNGMVATIQDMGGVQMERNQLITYDYWDENCVVQDNVPSWGLSRVNKRDLANVDGTYYYQGSAGEGVTVYTIDTGIQTTHVEFEDRASWGANFVDTDDFDGDGHGTHVTGTSIGVNVGLAKKAKAVAVKILDNNGVGTVLGAIQGIEWAVADHQARLADGENRSVANLSFGGAFSSTLNDAIDAAVDVGVLFSIAAGNDGSDISTGDACSYSPASAPMGMSVAASDERDNRAYYSNFGTCVDIYAPGDYITSSYIGSDFTYAVLSGTSMAAPHVAGVAAVVWGQHGAATATEIKARILELATTDAIVGAYEEYGTPNLLLWADYECSGEANLTDWTDVVFSTQVTTWQFVELAASMLSCVLGLFGVWYAQRGADVKSEVAEGDVGYGALGGQPL